MEKNMKKNLCIWYIYLNHFVIQENYHSIVNKLYFNKINFLKKEALLHKEED